MWDQINNTQPKIFDKSTKPPKIFPKTWKPRSKCMKCMKIEKKKRFRALTKWKKLGLGQNLEGRKLFGEKKKFGSREKRERSKYLKWSKIGSDLIYIYIYITQLDRLRRYRASIKNKILIDWEVSRRYQQQKISIDRGGIEHLSSRQRLQRIWLDGSSSLSKGIKNRPRNLDRRGMYQGGIEKLLRRCRVAIEMLERRFSRRRSSTSWMQARYTPKQTIKKPVKHKTELQLLMQNIPRSKTH